MSDLGAGPQAPGPMAELELWRERSSELSGLWEQLELPAVKNILKVMNQANVISIQNLNETISQLTFFHVEALENVRFLGTMERYFKVSQRF